MSTNVSDLHVVLAYVVFPPATYLQSQGMQRPDPHPEEKAILEAAPEMASHVAAIKQRGRKAPTR